MGHDHAAPMYREAKRLTHPACFPKYFLFRVPTGELPDQAVEDLIRQWNEAPESDTESLVGEVLQHYKGTGQLAELLVKLQTFAPRVSPAHLRAIIRGLYGSVPLMSHERVLLGSSEIQHAVLLTLRLVEEKAEIANMGPLVEEIVREVPSIPFAVLVVLSCHPGRGGRFPRITDAIDLQALRTLVSQRLHAYYVDGHRNIFAELPEDDWGFVLYQWGTDWMTFGGHNRSAVQAYVFSLVDQKPAYLGQLLQHFVDKSFGNNEGPFLFAQFCQVYDGAAVLGRLNRYGAQALITLQSKRRGRRDRLVTEETRTLVRCWTTLTSYALKFKLSSHGSMRRVPWSAMWKRSFRGGLTGPAHKPRASGAS